jgi:hypothetical protein
MIIRLHCKSESNDFGNTMPVTNGVHYGARFLIFHTDEIDFGNLPFKGFE